MLRAFALIALLAVAAGCSKSQDGSAQASASPETSAPVPAPSIATATPPAAAESAAATEAPSVAPASPEALASPQSAAPVRALSAPEIAYGSAPTRNPDVTYNADVIIPDGGANSVRSVSSDGLTWTIDGSAAHASDLAVGNILFITNRGVGRVLALTHTGGDIGVTIGPVEITEVITEAHLSGSNVAIDPASMYAYSAPDYPGASVDTVKKTALLVRPDIRFASDEDRQRSPEEIALNLPGVTGSGAPASTDIGGYAFKAFCCGGLGVEVKHGGSDVQILARAVLRMGRPSVDYKLDISGGKIVTAIVVLHGSVGLDMHVEASTPPDAIGNANKQFYVPVDLSFPIGGLAVPLALTVHQQFLLKTGFGEKNSSIHGDLNVDFNGDLNAGYQNGNWGLTAPDKYSDTNSGGSLDTVGGVTLSASAVEIAYEGRVIVGIGAFGFVTGPYVGFDAAYGLVNSDTNVAMGLPPCVAATMKTDALAGVGYSMPQTVTKAINSILHALNVAPIKGFGGISTSKTIKNIHRSRPTGCA